MDQIINQLMVQSKQLKSSFKSNSRVNPRLKRHILPSRSFDHNRMIRSKSCVHFIIIFHFRRHQTHRIRLEIIANFLEWIFKPIFTWKWKSILRPFFCSWLLEKRRQNFVKKKKTWWSKSMNWWMNELLAYKF